MEALRKSLDEIGREMNQIKMPIIDKFKDSLMKQRENAFKRTMKIALER
jgi:hypothetical protein